MRIVAGQFKGRIVDPPSANTTRPTTDRVRESIFSSIYSRLSDLDGLHALDAFAGSGALGLEALSRGAESCTFFERDASARKVLQDNISSFKLTAAQAPVCSLDVERAVAAGSVSADGAPFSLVLLDPPYALEASHVRGLVEQLDAHGDLAQNVLVVYEHALAAREEAGREFAASAAFAVASSRKYGKIAVSYITRGQKDVPC